MTAAYRSPLLDHPGAQEAAGPDAGVAWHYGEPAAEARAFADGRAVVDQSHLGVVTVTGPDRLTWLHSLTTAQLSDLPVGVSTELLVLDPLGHLEHAAGVVDDGTTTWLVTETAAALAAWLDRMRFMLRVEVADVSEQWAAVGQPIGLASGAPADSDVDGSADAGSADPSPLLIPSSGPVWVDPWPTTAAGGTRYGAPDDEHPHQPWRLTLVPRAELVPTVTALEAAGARLVGTWVTEAARIAAWRPRAVTEGDERTLPHELDWLRTAVHLNKGCYRGQETVARVHNLGRPPRRLVMLHLDGSGHVLPEPGAAVRAAGGREVGTVTSVARHAELGPIALAVVRRSTPVADDLLVASDDGDIAAAQEVIVTGEGVSTDRPVPSVQRSDLMRRS